MAYTAQTPIVYLACVNSFRNGKRIRYLVKERRALSNILSFNHQKPLFEPVIKDPSSQSYFFDFLNKNYDLERIKVLHFIGEAESEHLRVESGKAESSLHVNELSKFIALLPNLELVFLHGCATPKLMDMLVRRDVPAIMVCETKNRDSRANQIARTFYKDISRGATVKKALLSIQKDFPNFGAFRLDYDFDSDQIDWPFKLMGGQLPWGLYYLGEHEARLYEPMTKRSNEGISIPMRPQAGQESEGFSLQRFAAIAATIGLILAWVYFGQGNGGGLSQLLAF
ncbi:MAG: hypothetical protein AAF696_05560 [Bacteroidota bacterium]